MFVTMKFYYTEGSKSFLMH